MKKMIRNDSDSIISKKTSFTEDIEEPNRSQKLENTNDILFNQNNNIFILNKKLTKMKSKNKKKSNNSFFLNQKYFLKNMIM